MKHFTPTFIISALILFSSCGPDVIFPAEPQLTFKEYKPGGQDSLKVMFTFTDGDGDIGVSPIGSDSNMLLVLYYKAADGFFYQAHPSNDPGDSIVYLYRIQELPSGQNGLDGEIHLDVNTGFVTYDTIQFNAYLLDQTNHKSVVVRTPEIGIR